MKLCFLVCIVGIVLSVVVGVGVVGVVDLKFLVGEGLFNWDSYMFWVEFVLDLSGQIVMVVGLWLQLEDGYFCDVFVYFVEVIGVEVIYIGFDFFE